MSSPLYKEIVMTGFWIFMIITVICLSVLGGMYLFLCADEGVQMFEDKSVYERRLEELEYQVQRLMGDK